MPIATLFWVLFVVFIVLGAYRNRAGFGIGAGGDLILLALIGLIGWRLFGPILQ